MFETRLCAKLGLGLSILLLFLTFQNCSGALEAWSGLTPELLNAQNKAVSILSANCRSCHQDQSLGKIANILNVNHLVRSGLIKPGSPGESPLLLAVDNDSMPPSSALSLEEKSALSNWVLMMGGQGPLDPIDSDLSFSLTINTDPLPFRARLAKVAYLIGSIGNAALTALKTNRIFLGDYDFAHEITPKFSWEPGDMKVWLESIQYVCDSSDFRGKYPWPNGINAFLQNTVGRMPSSVEQNILQEVQLMNVSDDEKSAIFCLTTLSSLEFVSK